MGIIREVVFGIRVGRDAIWIFGRLCLHLMCIKLAPHFLILNVFLVVPGCSMFVLYCSRVIRPKTKKQDKKRKITVFLASPHFLKNPIFVVVLDCSRCSKHCSKVSIPQNMFLQRYSKGKPRRLILIAETTRGFA